MTMTAPGKTHKTFATVETGNALFVEIPIVGSQVTRYINASRP